MDVNTIPALLTSIKTATDIVKFIKESDLTFEKAESKLRLAELISTLADAKMQIAEIQQTLIDKENEVRALKAEKEIKASLIWETPYYWRIDGGTKEGPFCQPCYDKDKQLIRLLSNYPGEWNCRVCRQRFEDKNYHPHPLPTQSDYDPFSA